MRLNHFFRLTLPRIAIGDLKILCFSYLQSLAQSFYTRVGGIATLTHLLISESPVFLVFSVGVLSLLSLLFRFLLRCLLCDVNNLAEIYEIIKVAYGYKLFAINMCTRLILGNFRMIAVVITRKLSCCCKYIFIFVRFT